MSVVTETETDPHPTDGADERPPETPGEVMVLEPPPAASTVTALDTYKMVVQSITESANDPEFRAKFQEYLKIINPDGDDHVTPEEAANALKGAVVAAKGKMNALIKEEMDRGAPPEAIAKHLEEAGFPRVGDTGTPADFSTTAWLEKAAQECVKEKQSTFVDPNTKMLQEVLANYPDIVAALQVRSSVVGDLVLSDEEKALIPKLHPADAYSLPLFISIPSREQMCQVYKDSAGEMAATDPLRPLDTPKVPDTTPEQEKVR